MQIDNGEIRVRGGVMLRIGQNKAKKFGALVKIS